MKSTTRALFWLIAVALVFVLLLTDPPKRRPLAARVVVSVADTIRDFVERVAGWAIEWGQLDSEFESAVDSVTDQSWLRHRDNDSQPTSRRQSPDVTTGRRRSY